MPTKSYAFSCAHWALGSLVLVGLAASEFSGAGTVVALPVAALTATLSVLSSASTRSQKITPRKRQLSDIVDFFEIWFDVLEHLASAATCARVASATVDYTSSGRLREWLFGIESHSLGEPWPDVLGVSIVIVVSALFMLGLEKSVSFSILLFTGIVSTLLFFITVGGYHTDTRFWNWTEDFMQRNWGCVLTTAAMCAFAFPNNYSGCQNSRPRLKLFAFTALPLLIYSVITLIFTLMSHYRELAGTAIPLIRVFEVRDVDWARPIMAVGTICVVCIALTEIIPSLYELIIKLAGREWQIFVLSLLYQSSLTGAPVLAIFTAGSLASILAFACPLFYLVRLLNISPLIKCALRSCVELYNCYQPEYGNNSCSVYHSNIQYSKLSQSPAKVPTSAHKIKSVFDVLPRYLRQSSSMQHLHNKKQLKDQADGTVEDKEYLLLGDYNSCLENQNEDSSSEDEQRGPNVCSDVEETSSSTDIDAVVQEYRDTIQVTAVNTFSEKKTPTLLTCRVVILCTVLLIIAATSLSCSVLYDIDYLGWSSSACLIFLAIFIHLMPQNLKGNTNSSFLPRVLIPLVAITSITLNVILAMALMLDVWPGIIFWVIGGLFLFCRCDCCNCEGLYAVDREKQKLCSFQKECYSNGISHYKNRHVNTLLITR